MPNLLIRVLTPNDKEMLYEHYRDLDVDSKTCRFGTPISDYALRQFIESLDLERDVHFAIVQNNTILALAQVSQYSKAHPNRLELGISVATAARRHGFASLLWECAVDHARLCNMQDMHVIHAPQNHAMAAFCRSKGLRMGEEAGERVGVWTNPSWIAQHDALGSLSNGWPGMVAQVERKHAVVPTLLPA